MGMVEDNMTLVEYAEKIAPVPLSDFQKELIAEYEEAEKKALPLCVIPARNIGKDFISPFRYF